MAALDDQRRAASCRVYWGSHGCMLERGHDGAHHCVCDLDGDFDPVTRLDSDGVHNVGGPPYYGPETRFYGEDAETLGLPLVKDRD